MNRTKGIVFLTLGIVLYLYIAFFAKVPLFDIIHSNFERFNGYSMDEVEWIKIEYLPDEYRDNRDGRRYKMVNIEKGDLVARFKEMLDGVKIEKFGDDKNDGMRGGGYDLGLLGKYKDPDTDKYRSVRLAVTSTNDDKVVFVCYDRTIGIYPLAK